MPRKAEFKGDVEETSVKEAKDWLKQNILKGASCPCCNRLVKVYKRKLNAGMAAALIHIFKITKEIHPKGGWIHIPDEFLKRGLNAMGMEYSKLQHWKLIEQYMPVSKDPERLGAGYWRITDLGRAFVRRESQMTVPKYALIYDQQRIGYDGARISVREALSDKFDYQELMS